MGDETTSVQRAGRSVLVPRASTSSLEVCHFHGHRPKVLVLVRTKGGVGTSSSRSVAWWRRISTGG